jgi:hypothetical protein
VPKGIAPTDVQSTILILEKLGLPDDAIDEFGSENRSTEDEAVALKGWIARHPTSFIIIPVEPFFTRRVRWAFLHELAGAGVRVQVQSVTPRTYSIDNWWQSGEGATGFPN